MEPPSAFDRALTPARAEKIPIDRQFRELLDDVRFGPTSQRYWTRVAWPRFCALAERLPGRPQLEEPARTRMRRLLGRGPSLAAVRDLVTPSGTAAMNVTTVAERGQDILTTLGK